MNKSPNQRNDESTNQLKIIGVPKILIPCLLLVGLWLVMSVRSIFSPHPFDDMEKDLMNAFSDSSQWQVEQQPVLKSLIEPNILALKVTGGKSSNESTNQRIPEFPNQRINESTIYSRLAHGYNMPDCMRIKGYAVDLIGDSNQSSVTSLPSVATQERRMGDRLSEEGTIKELQVTSYRLQNGSLTTQQPNNSTTKISSARSLARYSPWATAAARDLSQPFSPPSLSSSQTQVSLADTECQLGQASFSPQPFFQLWKLTSPTDDVSLWVTSMLNAGDMTALDMDIRSMAFPKIGTPDDPGWKPTGFTWKSLRHPFRNLAWFLRARWNNSRCDLLVFLKLKKPVWASDEVFTLVSHSGSLGEGDDEEEVMRYVLSVHEYVYGELREAVR